MHLFRHGGKQNELDRDWELFGEPPPEMREYVEQDEDFQLFPENEKPLEIFLALQTQWRFGPIGATGLDYAGVAWALRLMRVKSTPELFDQIRLMERAALDCIAEA